MRSLFLALLFISGSVAFVLPTQAQSTNYANDCVTNGANNSTLVVEAAAAPTLLGNQAIAPGDTLIAYTENGNCAGYSAWTGTDDVSFPIAGPNTATDDPARQGYAEGETLKFKIYDTSEAQISDYMSEVTYSTCSDLGLSVCKSDGSYTANALFVVEQFSRSVLPVELTRFEAARTGSGVMLEWDTATETNNAGFEVQHQTDSGSWSTLSFVEGTGTTSSPQNYTYTATELEYGTHQFRLVQVDQDGTRHEKSPVEIDLSLDSAYKISEVYPNPVRHTGTLDLVVREAQHVTVQMYDVLGRMQGTLLDRQLAASQSETLRLDTGSFSSGQYFLRIQGESFSVTRRLTIVK
jgi:hypothetical protein